MLTAAAMLAFAGNSIICRLALADGLIDPASFTNVRMVAAALTLLLLVSVRGQISAAGKGRWSSAAALFGYAICFSFAYVHLDTATGALVLFGAVQATMLAIAMVQGERPFAKEWLGWGIAAGGFLWMLLPGANAPSPRGFLLMAMAGMSWGLYSQYGRSEANALAATTGNFVRALVPIFVVAAVTLSSADISAHGIFLAMLSGALTSALGYVLWYAALPYLSGLQAALVQLSVPGIAALGGALFVQETPSLRVVSSGLLILGGILVAVMGRQSAAIDAEAASRK